MTRLINRLLKPFDLAIVRRTQLVEAMLDRRYRSVPVAVERRRANQPR